MRFTLNDRGVAQLVNSKEVERWLDDAGDQVKEAVESQASRFQRTRRFARSIRKTPVRQSLRGVKITIYSDDFAAHIIEQGSANNTPYAPFRKAAAALGLRLLGGGGRP